MFCIRRYGSASLSGAWIACSLYSFCWMQRSPRNDLTIAGRNTEHLLTTEGYETESYHGGLLKCWSHISIFTLYEHIFGHLGKHMSRAYFFGECATFDHPAIGMSGKTLTALRQWMLPACPQHSAPHASRFFWIQIFAGNLWQVWKSTCKLWQTIRPAGLLLAGKSKELSKDSAGSSRIPSLEISGLPIVRDSVGPINFVVEKSLNSE